MKRTFAIATLCVLLVATVGTTAAVAEQRGKSSVYQFDVVGAQGAGKLTINLDQHKYVFTGKGFAPYTRYWLQCDALGRTFGSVVTNPAGNLNFQGTWPRSIATLPAAPPSGYFTLRSLATEPLTASFTARYDHSYQGCSIWEIDASTSTGPIVTYNVYCTYTDTAGKEAHGSVSAWEPDMGLQLCNIAQGTTVTATLTVTDTSGHTATDTQTLPWS
ncbi:MAG: hypothetical protein ACXV3E_01990 [Halobacteriota archaeon]